MTHALEILIHISAQSRVQDDAKYRKQAQGYLDFRATTRHGCIAGRDSGPEHTTADTALSSCGANNAPEETNPAQPGVRRCRTFPVLRGHGKIASCSEENTVDNIGTSLDHGLQLVATPAQVEKQVSLVPAGSTDTTSKIHVKRTPFPARAQTVPPLASPVTAVIHRPRSHSESWQTPPSVVPDSQPSHGSLKRSQPISSSFASSTGSVSPLAKRQRVKPTIQRPSSTAETNVGHPRTTGEEPTTENQSSLQSERSCSPYSDEKWCPPIAEIQPPPPETSLAGFITHVTSSLTTLASKAPIQTFFCPSCTTRPLRVHERGYWQFTMDKNWSPDLQKSFWKFLENLVGTGRAGWGVWCELYGNHLIENQLCGNVKDCRKPRGLEESADESKKSLKEAIVKVYCWGEIVPYIYLALFVGSDRRIVQSGAVWVDSASEVVVTMSGNAVMK